MAHFCIFIAINTIIYHMKLVHLMKSYIDDWRSKVFSKENIELLKELEKILYLKGSIRILAILKILNKPTRLKTLEQLAELTPATTYNTLKFLLKEKYVDRHTERAIETDRIVETYTLSPLGKDLFGDEVKYGLLDFGRLFVRSDIAKSKLRLKRKIMKREGKI